MNRLENGVIKYQLDFEKYKNGQANEIIALLDKSDAEIARYLKRTKGVYTKERYREILKKLREISKSLKDNVDENMDIDGVIDYELKKQEKLLGLIPKKNRDKIHWAYPSREQIKTAAMFKPATDGLTYDSYLNGIQDGLFNVWDSAVRTGYLTGQTTQQIVSKVMGGVTPETRLKNPGLINSLRNSIYGNTRTLLQSFAEETKERVYKANEQYFGDGEYKYERLGCIDSHTCIACGSIDGRLYRTLEEAQPVILHRNCRCLLIPYFDIEGDTRASRNGYVSSKVTFSDWLGEQDEKTQKDVLGVTRYKMFKNGTKIDQFVDNGKVLTLKELDKTLDEE